MQRTLVGKIDNMQEQMDNMSWEMEILRKTPKRNASDWEKNNNNTVTEVKNAFVGFIKVNWSESYSVMSNSLQPHGLYRPWNSPGQNTGVSNHSLLQGILPTQGSNPHCRQILYQLSYKGWVY